MPKPHDPNGLSTEEKKNVLKNIGLAILLTVIAIIAYVALLASGIIDAYGT